MKKIGEYTARGTVSEDDTADGNPQKIPLFDGRFDTAYRVVEFYVFPATFSSSSAGDVCGKLSKNGIGTTGTSSFWRADDDNQIAWAGTSGGVDYLGTEANIIDRDNLVVEDLFVYARTQGSASQPINYLVVMEKYEITDWQGALSMARDRIDGE